MFNIQGPGGNIVGSQDNKPEHRMFVTAAETGEHLVCFAVKQPIPNSICKLYPSVYLGDPGDSRITSPAEAALTEAAHKVSNNNALLGEISEIQKLQREREHTFRSMSNTLHRNVYWLAAIQMAVLGLTAFWQMRYLKKFFQAKKLV